MQKPISERLKRIASFVPEGARLLDVGSDHAYLPIYLLETQKINYAIAGEVVEGPFESAKANVAESNLSQQIDVRLANGLAAFSEEDAIECIVIAGMGGRLIAEILENGKEKLTSVKRLVLQPNNREDDLRVWLEENEFTIIDEEIMEENDKFYEILIVEPGLSTMSDIDKRFGPVLRHFQSKSFREKWKHEAAKLEYALEQVPEAKTDERQILIDKINVIRGVLNDI